MTFRDVWISGLGFLLLPLGVMAQEPPAAPVAAETGDDAQAVSHIDAVADQKVRAMSEFLSKQERFRFVVEIAYDAVEADGQKVQLGRRSRVDVMRPNGLYVESLGDRGWNQVNVFDGQHFLHYDRSQNVYSRIETPSTLDEFFQFLFDKYGASPPLVDFLVTDVHGALTGGAEASGLLGDAVVAETECDHISFSGELLDWQLWIQKGDKPWPRKFVITYKDVDVRPQFMAVFREWETGAALDAAKFATAPPEGAREVPLERSDEGESGEGADSDGASSTEGPKE